MVRTAAFVQLTLWAAAVQGFFPWFPSYLCATDGTCPDSRRSLVEGSLSAGSSVEIYKLSRKVHESDADRSARAVQEAGRLLRKYGNRRSDSTSRTRPDLGRRSTTFSVVPPAAPSQPNSIGIYQDGTDFSYFVQASLGISGKKMFMLVDTGAGTTWLMGSDCESSACKMHNSFGASDSTTLQVESDTFSISYGSGSVSGSLAKDKISVAGLDISMTFGIANVTSDDFTHFPFDGILGLSMSTGATDNFVQALKDTKALESNIFGISLSRNADGPNTGELSFGAPDPSKYSGTISYTDIAAGPGGDWALKMDDLAYNDKKAGVTGRIAYIDTGTSYVFGPPDDVAALHKLIPGATSSDGVTYTVPCDSNLDISVSFSGVEYAISSKDWLSGRGEQCTSNIFGHAVVRNAWLLGDLFLKNVYAVFDADQSRIGFAAKPVPSPSPTSISGSTTSSLATVSQASKSDSSLTSPAPGPSSVAPLPGLSGHESAVSAAAQTAKPTATSSKTSSAGQLGWSDRISALCLGVLVALAL
ncbi:hypothetical protein VTK73DRAFT_11 [Phialemonium thermophilum]|uniref:Peptidase A1 domain-containing protein n=1 Tax=Phialemonium thermophilum TaxID=223376 RepID=A0ABR3Y8Y6_9PEZI